MIFIGEFRRAFLYVTKRIRFLSISCISYTDSSLYMFRNSSFEISDAQNEVFFCKHQNLKITSCVITKCISLWMDLLSKVNVFQQSMHVLGKQIGSIISLVKLLVEKNGTICVRRSNGGLYYNCRITT